MRGMHAIVLYIANYGNCQRNAYIITAIIEFITGITDVKLI